MSSKWLYIASSPFPTEAANAVHVAHMCSSLMSAGVKVRLAVPSSALWRKRLQDLNLFGLDCEVRLFPLWSPGIRGGGIFYRLMLRLLLTATRDCLVYGRSLTGCRIAADSGKVTVFEIHKPEWEYSERNLREFRRLVDGKGLRAIVCISSALEAHLLMRFPELKGMTFVAHDAARTIEKPQDEKRSDKFIIGYFGSLHPGKGVETILEVAPLCPWATFWIVGGDIASVKHWQKNGNIASNVYFLGYRLHRELPAMMAQCSVLVAPYLKRVSVHGGGGDVARWMSPLKLFEYMAMARPIISADLPVLREILRDNENALLAEPGDALDWLRSIERLRDSPELGRQLAQQARADYELKHTWGARVQHIRSELRHLKITAR